MPEPEVGKWAEYVARVSGDATATEIMNKMGRRVNRTTPMRWAEGASPQPAQAALFALAYGRLPVEAFVAAGWLTIEEARKAIDADAIKLLTELGIPQARSEDEVPPTQARRAKTRRAVPTSPEPAAPRRPARRA
jgi:hypothetical protein